jgi:hypothetical protein
MDIFLHSSFNKDYINNDSTIIESGYGKMTGNAHFIFRKVRATS